MARQIYITQKDQLRILEQISNQREFGTGKSAGLDELERELNRAIVVDSKEIPGDVITMNTVVQVRFEDDPEDLEELTLVYPKDASPDENKISITAPVGTALLGYRKGDQVEWDVPSGKVRITVVKILYQPEASGDYDR